MQNPSSSVNEKMECNTEKQVLSTSVYLAFGTTKTVDIILFSFPTEMILDALSITKLDLHNCDFVFRHRHV